MSITERYDASTAVSGGSPAGTMGQYIEDLKGDCGFIISKVDWVVQKLCGHSPLEWLFQQIAGDFDAISSMQLAWKQVSDALDEIGDNYAGLAGDLPPVWQGLGGTAAAGRLGDVSSMHHDQGEAGDHVQDQLGHVIEVAQATAEVVAAALNFIDDVVQELLLDAAAGPLGWAKGAFTAPGKARKVFSLIRQATSAIEKFTKAVKAAVTVMKYVNAGLVVADNVLQFGNVVESSRAGNHTDDTADQGF